MPVPDPEDHRSDHDPHRLRRRRRRGRASAGLAADRPGEGLGRVRLLRPALRPEARRGGGGPLTWRPSAPGSHLHLIDGSGFIFRAYHALPPLTRKSDGLPVGAVAGFSQHGLEDAAGDQGRRRADPRRGRLRQVRGHLPQRALPRLQGAPAAGARRPRAAVPADPRRDPRLQPALHRAWRASRPTTSSPPTRRRPRRPAGG